MGVWGRRHQVILSLAVKTRRFWSAGDMIFKKNYQDRIFESWFSLWQSQKFEQISRDVYEVLVVARENHQVTQEHVSILLTCVQELIAEVTQEQPLSREFREKYMG